MVRLKINNREFETDDNTTILECCDKNHIYIPRLCYLKDINEVNACRVCLVEIENVSELVPSCTTKCTDGMVIYTHSKKVIDARKNQIKFLLSNHNYNCAVCAKNAVCRLRKLAETYNIIDDIDVKKCDKYIWEKNQILIRDNAKCIKCGRCVNICEKVEGVGVWDYIGKGKEIYIDVKDNKRFSKIDCTLCGQCIVNCPTGALVSRDDTTKLIDAINDKEKVVVVQVAPAVRTAWTENLDNENKEVNKMVSAIRELGVDYVFDTNFSADLTIMEETSEFLLFLKNRKNKYPMFTSCCPAWVRYMKQKHKDLINNLSTSKSPQQMFGAITKSYFAMKMNIDPKNIYSVSIMPCTAKKYECDVKSLNASEEYKDVDLSITTRELSKLIKMYGIDIDNIKETDFDSPLGVSTGAGVIFGSSGGVMEAALRTAYYFVYGKNPDPDTFKVMRGNDGIRYAEVDLNGIKVKAAVVYGLKNIETLIDDIKNDKISLDFVEVMTCPNGCINGGGQPEKAYEDIVFERKDVIYLLDKSSNIRFSHENPEIKVLYDEYLEKPLSEKAEQLLHTNQEKWTL